MGDVIGSGSFGQVRLATLKNDKNTVRAVKIIERDDQEQDQGELGKVNIIINIKF